MRSGHRYPGVLGWMAALLLAFSLTTARAGDADYEGEDDHEHGAPFFGEAKDLKNLAPLPGVRIKAQVKGTLHFVIVSTDEDGRFRMQGLGKEIKSEAIEVSCDKDGYRLVDVMRRRMPGAADAPVEIECLLERSSS